MTLDDGSTLSGERLLVATGRHATLSGLGLETVGLDPEARSIEVDALCRTTVDGIWAIGDVTGRAPFTHVAVQHARLVIDQILGRDPAPMDYRGIAWVTFTEPEVGRVGMTAIGSTPAAAQELYDAAEAALLEEARQAATPPSLPA